MIPKHSPVCHWSNKLSTKTDLFSRGSTSSRSDMQPFNKKQVSSIKVMQFKRQNVNMFCWNNISNQRTKEKIMKQYNISSYDENNNLPCTKRSLAIFHLSWSCTLESLYLPQQLVATAQSLRSDILQRQSKISLEHVHFHTFEKRTKWPDGDGDVKCRLKSLT